MCVACHNYCGSKTPLFWELMLLLIGTFNYVQIVIITVKLTAYCVYRRASDLGSLLDNKMIKNTTEPHRPKADMLGRNEWVDLLENLPRQQFKYRPKSCCDWVFRAAGGNIALVITVLSTFSPFLLICISFASHECYCNIIY